MLTQGRNISAETAFTVAVNNLFHYGQDITQAEKDQIWELCHSNANIQWATTGYLAATSDYAPKAYQKLLAVLKHYLAEIGL